MLEAPHMEAFMNAGRRWVLSSALIVVAPVAALSQVQQAAAPAGMLNSTAAPAAVTEFKAALEDNFNLAHTSSAERMARALQLDSTFGLARAWRAAYTGGPTVAAEAQRAAHDALNASAGEAVLALSYREAAAGRAPNSRRLLTVAAEMMPNDRQVAMWRAVNMPDTARHNALREISAKNPDYAASRIQLAIGLVTWNVTITEAVRANGDEAMRVAEEAVRITPQSSGAHYALGHVLHSLGRDAEATSHLVAATKLTPVAWIAWDALADIYNRDGKIIEMRAVLDSGIKYAPNIGSKAAGRRLKALAYFSEGDAKRAMDDHAALVKDMEAIDARGQLATTHLNMAILAAGMRDSAGAEAHYNAAKPYNPAAGLYADNGVIVYSLIGNGPAARTALNDYIRITTATPPANAAAAQTRDENIHRQTGLTLFAEKKYAEAVAELKQGGANPYAKLGLIESYKGMKNNKEADATRAALFASREFTSNSTATPVIRYRARK